MCWEGHLTKQNSSCCDLERLHTWMVFVWHHQMTDIPNNHGGFHRFICFPQNDLTCLSLDVFPDPALASLNGLQMSPGPYPRTPKLRSNYLILRWKGVPFSGSCWRFLGWSGFFWFSEYIGIVTDHMADGICQFSLGEDSEVRFCCGRVWRWAG